MNKQLAQFVDSAFAIALLTAILYFFGTCNLNGDAMGLDLAPIFVSRDLWGTVAYGAEGALGTSILLPLRLFGSSPTPWAPFLSLGVAVLFVCVVVFATRRSSYQAVFVTAASALAMGVHLQMTSIGDMNMKVDHAFQCLTKSQCDHVALANKVDYFAKGDADVESRTGIILVAGTHYLTMLTTSGLLVIPLASVRSIETAPRASAGE